MRVVILNAPEGVTESQVIRAIDGYEFEIEYDANDEPFESRVLVRLTLDEVMGPGNALGMSDIRHAGEADALNATIERLGAVEVFRPDPITCGQYDQEQRQRATRYAYPGRTANDSRWYLVSEAMIMGAETWKPKAAPDWWSPQHREIMRFEHPQCRGRRATCQRRGGHKGYCSPWDASDRNPQRITADLTTGEEVAA